MLFRVLNKKLKWMWEEPITWLDDGDIPADPLNNLATSDNTLSVYEVNNDRWRIERVAAAMVAGRNKSIDDIEFIAFDQSILDEVGIVLDPTKRGTTCDKEVNLWHRDMIEISATKLVAFAKRIVPTVHSDLVLEKRIRQVIIDTGKAGKYEWSKVQLPNKNELKLEIDKGP